MIEEKIERGIYNNFIRGYNHGIELITERKTMILDEKGASFLERYACDNGLTIAFMYFPLIHPKIELRNIIERSKKIRDFVKREK